MPRAARTTPAERTPGWPDTPLADPAAEIARRVAVAARGAIGERSIRSVAADCELNHATLLALLDGRGWADLETVAKLEQGLGIAVWPPYGS